MSNRDLRLHGCAVVAGLCLTTIGGGLVAADEPPSAPPPASTASAIVARRIDAFNRHDLDAYLEVHHPKVEIFRYPDRVLGTSRAHLRKIFGPAMRNEHGRIETAGQFVLGDTVISNEFLTLAGTREHYVAIYRIVDGQIVAIRLIESGK